MSNQSFQNNAQSSNSPEKNDDLWKNLKIDFTLENSVFFDNKIYGIIEISPEEARELIENFVLVIDNSIRVEFNAQFQNIWASGFDPTKGKTLVLIKAIPKNTKMMTKTSGTQEFSIVRKHSSLAPTIIFEEAINDLTPYLIVQWFHLGDSIAEKYVLVLNGNEIVYIRRPSQSGVYKVCIKNLKLDKNISHTIYIIARLNNDEETYRSDPIKFTIPYKVNQNNRQVIKVYVDNYANQLTKERIEQDNDKKPSSLSGDKQHTHKIIHSISLEQSSDNKNHKFKIVCTHLSDHCKEPHDDFPGISHYFERNSTKALLSSCTQSRSTNNHKSTLVLEINITSLNKKDTHDDDSDVIIS
ncbi:unnamed protein product [Rotaria sordida]|uniref:Uncharacterized protein n=1 Tax=Rotaria sordida TaxID=392033 RepID=A0A818ZGQ7_9BILA|nr:unnamed protein product [Rotaria sordida]CAF1184890.1 unnamed protein product [Rotaria sordida]CAF1200440.1 unnamed protein product [Rotaria sordida]CAF1471905.1 unnamed protein product [Rotaria sordida]CAF3704354.1 unnamed protein product [Rotaria sordida]